MEKVEGGGWRRVLKQEDGCEEGWRKRRIEVDREGDVWRM